MKLSGIGVATTAGLVMITWLSFLASTTNAQNFDFFHLVMQWPRAVCNHGFPNCRSPVPRNFTIHGMWPMTNSGGGPHNCPGSVRDVRRSGRVDRATLGAMDSQWPNLKRVKGDMNSRLWTDEWNKHGTCSALPMQSYFRSAVDRAASADLLGDLGRTGIHPDNQLYWRNDISNAFRRYNPVVRCSRILRRRKFVYQIHEIRLCVRKDGSGIVPCGQRTQFRSCGYGLITFSR